MRNVIHDRIEAVPMDLIRSTKLNPRKRFDDLALKELADSVESLGILQPLLLRPIDGGLFEIVAGERRFRAAKLVKLPTVPALIRELDAEEAAEARLCENLQREDLDVLEEAEGLRELSEVFKLSAFVIGEKIGKSKAYVYARLKLLELPKRIKKAMTGEPALSPSVALLLARWPSQIADAALPSMFEWRDEVEVCKPVRQAKAILSSNFCRRLTDATWDLETLSMVEDLKLPALPACRGCPKRAGNEPELFEGVLQAEVEKVSADVCTDPDCFDLKLEGAGAAVLAKAKEAGSVVMTPAEARKKIFPYGGQHIQNGYIDLDKECWEAGRAGAASSSRSRPPKWKTAIAGRKKIPAEKVTVVIDPEGQVRRLMKRPAAVKLAATEFDQGWAKKSAPSNSEFAAKEKKAAAARKKAKKVRELIVEKAIPVLIERAEEFWTLDITRLVAGMLWDLVGSPTRKAIGARRKWPVTKGQSAWMGPLLPAKQLRAKDLRGVVLEILAYGGDGHEYDRKLKKQFTEIAAAMGVDLVALRKEAMAELRPAKKTKKPKLKVVK